MPNLRLDGSIAQDDWVLTDDPAGATAAGAVLTASAYLAAGAPDGVTQIALEATDDVSALAPHLHKLQGVGIVFAGFMDGRGFSQARQLREHCGYTGPLRALGLFMRDQLFYLKRCGFDSFALGENVEAEPAVAVSLRDFTEVYQAGADQTLPLFRRRH